MFLLLPPFAEEPAGHLDILKSNVGQKAPRTEVLHQKMIRWTKALPLNLQVEQIKVLPSNLQGEEDMPS